MASKQAACAAGATLVADEGFKLLSRYVLKRHPDALKGSVERIAVEAAISALGYRQLALWNTAEFDVRSDMMHGAAANVVGEFIKYPLMTLFKPVEDIAAGMHVSF